MNKKIIILIIAAFIIAAITNYKVFADEVIRQNRLSILNKMKNSTEIEQDSRVYRTQHFNVFTDEKSIEAYDINSIKKLQASMLRICYILEEAYAAFELMIDEKSRGKFDVAILAPEIYMKQYQKSDAYHIYYTGSRVWICVPREAMTDPLGSFDEDIGSLYWVYINMSCFAKWGSNMAGSGADEFSNYFREVGQATSRWANTLSDEERQQIINKIDVNYTFLFKKYPDIFIRKEVNKVYMKCGWCHKEIDITEIRKGSRIKCPHCEKTITVE